MPRFNNNGVSIFYSYLSDGKIIYIDFINRQNFDPFKKQCSEDYNAQNIQNKRGVKAMKNFMKTLYAENILAVLSNPTHKYAELMSKASGMSLLGFSPILNMPYSSKNLNCCVPLWGKFYSNTKVKAEVPEAYEEVVGELLSKAKINYSIETFSDDKKRFVGIIPYLESFNTNKEILSLTDEDYDETKFTKLVSYSLDSKQFAEKIMGVSPRIYNLQCF